MPNSISRLARRRLVLAGSTSLLVAVALCGSVLPVAAATGPYLVKNINKSGSSSPDQLTPVGGTLFFTADDGVHGRELWKSDGTATGTQMVKDITPGTDTASYSPGGLKAIGGLLYFGADDSVHGYEPWVSDGTADGTRMIKDVQPGAWSSDSYSFTEYSGAVYFSAGTSVSGRELWRTDGTELGTELVADVAPGTASSNPSSIVSFAGKLYFLRHENGSCGVSGVLYRTDGTAAGTKPVLSRNGSKIKGRFPMHCSARGALWVVGDDLYIGRAFKEMWVTKGTKATTGKLVDVGARNVVDVGGTAYFQWDDGADVYPDSQLWKSDGTTAGTVPIFFSDGDPIYPGFLTKLGNNLLFWAADLSISDGTDDGTERLGVYAEPVDATDGWFQPPSRALVDSVLYFGAVTYDSEHVPSDPQVWRTDGTTDGTYPVGPAYASGILANITGVGQSVFFVAQAGKGAELYRYEP